MSKTYRALKRRSRHPRPTPVPSSLHELWRPGTLDHTLLEEPDPDAELEVAEDLDESELTD